MAVWVTVVVVVVAVTGVVVVVVCDPSSLETTTSVAVPVDELVVVPDVIVFESTPSPASEKEEGNTEKHSDNPNSDTNDVEVYECLRLFIVIVIC